MNQLNIHCVRCGSVAEAQGGMGHCPACTADFEYLLIPKPDRRLEYAGPPPKKAPDRCCLWALLLSPLSVIPPVGIAVVILAIRGIRRVRRDPLLRYGEVYAALAIAVVLLGTDMFIKVAVGLPAARNTADQVHCQSNLRQIGLAIAQYENSHPQARGYTLADLAAFSPGLPLRCPAEEGGTTLVPSYVLLSPLQPYRRVSSAPETVVAFELTQHKLYNENDRATGAGINLLYADGHVDCLPTDQATQAIQSSLLPRAAQNPRPSTQPKP